MTNTKEPQYQAHVDSLGRYGRVGMGVVASDAYRLDPWRIAFTSSRYKFVASMLQGKNNVIEVGCGDAFYSRLVAAKVKQLSVTDFDPYFVAEASNHSAPPWQVRSELWDVLLTSYPRKQDSSTHASHKEGIDAIYALHVVEHIAPTDENLFFQNLADSLLPNGIFIFGTPSLESQQYASPLSVQGHVNCKTQTDWIALASGFYENIFAFSMNDEVIHTGYAHMAHYLFFLCVTPKQNSIKDES